jgi:opacity protein-like surface antigen
MRLPIICALAFLLVPCSPAPAAFAQEQVATVPAGEPQRQRPPSSRRIEIGCWCGGATRARFSRRCLPGVEMEAIARDAQWYQVRVPEKYAGAGGAVGFVYKGHVEKLSGPEPPALPTVTDRAMTKPAPATPAGIPRAADTPRAPTSGSSQTTASRRSSASRGGFFYGGGGQAIFRNIFVDVGWEQFKKSGSRVAVVDGEVFPVGIKDTITMQPFRVTGGYRFRLSNGNTAYVGGGAGSLRFKEVSEFAEPGDNTDESFASWNVVAGAEARAMKYLFFSVEFRYEGVPNAVGAPGVAGEFGEKDLGGFGIGVKLLVGR